MVWNRFCNFAALFLAIFLVACGSDDSNGEDSSFAEIISMEDLGVCTINRDGDTVHVRQNSTDYACAGENWIDISTLPGISDSVKQFVRPTDVPSVYDLVICTRKIEGEVKLDLETGLSYVCHFPQWQLMVPFSEMHHNLKESDEGDSSGAGDYIEVETLYDLGLCDSLNRNLRVHVLAGGNYYICRAKGWQRDTTYRDYLVVDDRQNLPLCDVENDGQRAFLKKDSVFFACGSKMWEPETNEGYLLQNASITGAAQKGPFKFNSPLMLREMFLHSDSLFYTGREYVDEISSNKGDFVIPKVRMVYPYAELEVRGLWRNEISGEWSKDSMTLRVLTDLSERTDVNINLLTHLEYSRAVNLVNSGYSVPAAKKQADYEIMTAFGFATSVDYSEDLETFVDSSSIHYDANAALMAISLLFIGERTDGEVQNAIDAFASDMAEDGEWSDEVAKAEMADWAEGFDGAPVRVNVKSWNILDIPNFENYLTDFWNNTYGLGGCAEARYGTVIPNSNQLSRNYNVHYICKFGGWQKASDYEKDTYGWQDGAYGELKEGNVTGAYYVFENGVWAYAENENALGLCQPERMGEVSKVDGKYLICRSDRWERATVLEFDTYGWEAGTEGEVRPGSVNPGKHYVFENGAWRESANGIESNFGACVEKREGEIIDYGGGSFYICKSKVWITATPLEYDTYGWEAGTEGEVKPGSVNTDKFYVFENGAWREPANGIESKFGACVWSREGKLVDYGDGNFYICKSFYWKSASVLEYDTYGWTAGTEGEVRPGRVNTDKYYVYEDGVWRISASTVENDLGACVTSREGEVGRSGSTYYICKSKAWEFATRLEYDTYDITCFKDGSIVKGRIFTENNYVCDDGLFRRATEQEISLDKGCVNYTEGIEIRKNILANLRDSVYRCDNKAWLSFEEWIGDTLIDGRDGQSYKVVVIGTQTWMAENLNIEYKTTGTARSYCPYGRVDSCMKYGRLYNLSATLDAAGLFSNEYACNQNWSCSHYSFEIIRGICPEGWHIPDTTDWNTLFTYVGGTSIAGKMLKSVDNGGVDSYGFSVLQAGYYDDYEFKRYYSYFYGRWLIYGFDNYGNSVRTKSNVSETWSIRCLKDSKNVGSSSSSTVASSSSLMSSSSTKSSSSVTSSSSVKDGSLYNASINTLKDLRDDQTYRTVEVGSQTWMAENLNYDYNVNTAKSYCYEDNANNCETYGRFYMWSAAMDSAAVFSSDGAGCGGVKNSCRPNGTVRGVCPKNWHLPNNEEWRNLFTYMSEMSETADGYWPTNGWEEFKFDVVFAGFRTWDGTYYGMGTCASFASSFADDINHACSADVRENFASVCKYVNTLEGISVRCVKDDENSGSSSSNLVVSSSSAVSSSSFSSSSSFASSSSMETMVDVRDGHEYKIVTINSQTWMAENLNYSVKPGRYSWCGGGSGTYEGDCSTYGRLYVRQTAMEACPPNWHLPSLTEWETLFKSIKSIVDKSEFAYYYLNVHLESYGFSLLRAGFRSVSGNFEDTGINVDFWTSSLYYIEFRNYDDSATAYRNGVDTEDIDLAYSVRCVKD